MMNKCFSAKKLLILYPSTGYDVITKGFFTINWAYFFNYNIVGNTMCKPRYKGEFHIDGNDTNPLYDIAVKEPLRLQGLIGTIDMGNEKRFIKVLSISEYKNFEASNNRIVILSNVEFELLENLDYLEEIDSYRNENLI